MRGKCRYIHTQTFLHIYIRLDALPAYSFLGSVTLGFILRISNPRISYTPVQHDHLYTQPDRKQSSLTMHLLSLTALASLLPLTTSLPTSPLSTFYLVTSDQSTPTQNSSQLRGVHATTPYVRPPSLLLPPTKLTPHPVRRPRLPIHPPPPPHRPRLQLPPQLHAHLWRPLDNDLGPARHRVCAV